MRVERGAVQPGGVKEKKGGKKSYNAPGCPLKKLPEGNGSGPRAATGEDGEGGPRGLCCRCPSVLLPGDGSPSGISRGCPGLPI